MIDPVKRHSLIGQSVKRKIRNARNTVEFVGGPEWCCFSDVTSWGYIMPATQSIPRWLRNHSPAVLKAQLLPKSPYVNLKYYLMVTRNTIQYWLPKKIGHLISESLKKYDQNGWQTISEQRIVYSYFVS